MMSKSLANKLVQLSDNLSRPRAYHSYGRLIRINGMVLTVVGGNYTVGQCYQIENSQGRWCEAEVIGFENDAAYLMPLSSNGSFSTHARVRPCNGAQQLVASEQLLGRVLDGLGQPLDNLRPVTQGAALPTELEAINPMQKKGVDQPLDVGIKAINGLFTVGRGQRLGLFAGSGVGKSKLLGMMTRFTVADVVIVAMVGERGWEVREFIEQSLGEEGLRKSIVIAAPADQSPLLRMRSAELAHRLAAWFRDQGKHVLLLVDSLTRYGQAQREIALSVGEPPATRGYPPSVFSKLTTLVERAGNNADSPGSMTAIYTVLTEGDDLQDPIADAARAILDGHVVLSRELAEQGHYPAIDIAASISRVMPNIVSNEQLEACYQLKQLYARYRQVQELIPLGAYQQGRDSELDRAVALFPKIREFLIQGLTEQIDFSQTRSRLLEVMAADA